MSFLLTLSKLLPCFVKQSLKIFKDPKQVKTFRNYVPEYNLYQYFLMQQNLLISSETCWCQQYSRSVSHDSYTFPIFFSAGITVPSFIIVGYVHHYRTFPWLCNFSMLMEFFTVFWVVNYLILFFLPIFFIA